MDEPAHHACLLDCDETDELGQAGEDCVCVLVVNTWVKTGSWFCKMVFLAYNGCMGTVTMQFLNDQSVVVDLVLTDKNPPDLEHAVVLVSGLQLGRSLPSGLYFDA
jgi:hypothetical protein